MKDGRQPQQFPVRPINVVGKLAGFVNTGPGPTGMDDGFGMMLIITLLGAFCGMICGLLTSHLLRYVSFLVGRHLGGYQWVIIGSLAGAILFAFLSVSHDDSD